MRFGFEIESDKQGDTLYVIDSTAGINGLYMCKNGLEKVSVLPEYNTCDTKPHFYARFQMRLDNRSLRNGLFHQ